MVNIRKIDDYDFVFVNRPLTEKEEREFSEFLKARKTKTMLKRKLRTTNRTSRQYA